MFDALALLEVAIRSLTVAERQGEDAPRPYGSVMFCIRDFKNAVTGLFA